MGGLSPTPIGEATTVSRAFLREGWLVTRSYPSSFAVTEIGMLIPIVTYYFVARLVHTPSVPVGGDYYSFVVLGLVAWRLTSGASSIVAAAIQEALDQGRFEVLLVQPVSWRFLPFALAEWPLAIRVVNTGVGLGAALALGAHFRLGGLLAALAILGLGVGGALAVAALVASATLLTRKSETVLRVYSLAAGLLAGVFYPTSLLPGWVRKLSYAVPDTYVIATVRRLALPAGAAVAGPSPGVAAAALIVFGVVMVPLSIWVFGRVLDFGRKTGMLGRY